MNPGGTSEAEFFFYPRELKNYHERIPFEINGLSMFYVDLIGQGTEMKVGRLLKSIGLFTGNKENIVLDWPFLLFFTLSPEFSAFFPEDVLQICF